MGRYLTPLAAAIGALAPSLPWAWAPGRLDFFGTGKHKVFGHADIGPVATETWVVPAGITSIRVRVRGSGGSRRVSAAPNTGPTNSFGSLISATGGTVTTNTVGGQPGVGIGGDFQATGGVGGNGTQTWFNDNSGWYGGGGGGGQSGTTLGNGTPGVGGKGGGFASDPTTSAVLLPYGSYARFPGESFIAGERPYNGISGGAGLADRVTGATPAGWCAGGGCGGFDSAAVTPPSNALPYTGGGDGGAAPFGGGGGGGFAWGVFPVVPGTSYTITYGGNGSVVVEY